MRKLMRCVVLGAPRTGKTTILMNLSMFPRPLEQPYLPTIEDTFNVQTGPDTADRARELIVFHDTAGQSGDVEVKRSLIQVADVFILVFSVLDRNSFNVVDSFKKYIEKNLPRDKKETPIVVVGTMIDLPGRQVDSEFIQQWGAREKVRCFEICGGDRAAAVEIAHFATGRHFHSSREPKFSLSKKLKPERSNAQILMDF